ncbi:MAG: TM2 domain-containing protein [Akkermansia sp.]|nr:TM2 domain-containing protein [Akkermansia sp.]MBQ7022514.1 TM2 domain-containing protein [Akkermansia sp.]
MNNNPNISPLSRTTALLLALLGFFLVCGLHRLYAGKVISGLLQLITVGFFGIWQIIDILRLIFGSFEDSKGRVIAL